MTNLDTKPREVSEEFECEVKSHMRRQYVKTRDKLHLVTEDIATARKNGEPIGPLLRKRRGARQLLALMEEHGRNAVRMSLEDKAEMEQYYGRDNFIKHFWQYMTQYGK